MLIRETSDGEPSVWRRIWSRPEAEISDAAFSGELLIAGVRLLIVLILLYIPANEYLRSPNARDPRFLLGTAGAGLVAALMIYSGTRRNWGRSWMGFASSVLDISLVSGVLFLFVALGRPQDAIHDLVIFPVYFLAIGATSLRYDARVCFVTGLLALLQYLALAFYAQAHWDFPAAASTAAALEMPAAFRWSEQLWRMIQLGGATLLAATIVVRARELRLLSTRDRFTGLLNRAVFNEQLEREVAIARRENARFAVAMLDIDHFKRFNDTYGHAGGDQALRLVAETLRRSCRESDVVARYGGEEFALILPGVRSSRAQDLLERFRRVVSATPIHLAGRSRPVSLTVSIGVASWPDDGMASAEILACADRRLYHAKESGRDRVVGPPHGPAQPAERQKVDSEGGEESQAPLVPPDP